MCVPVEVVHGVTGVAGDLVQTLPSAHRLLDGVLVIHYFVVWPWRKRRERERERVRERG